MNYNVLHEPHFLLWISFSTMCLHYSNNIGLFGSSPMDLHTFFLSVTHFHLSCGFIPELQTPHLAFFFFLLATIPCFLKSQMSTTEFWFFSFQFSSSPKFPHLGKWCHHLPNLSQCDIWSHLWLPSVSHSCRFNPLDVSITCVPPSISTISILPGSTMLSHLENCKTPSLGFCFYLYLTQPMWLSENTIRLYYSFLLKTLKWLSVSWK